MAPQNAFLKEPVGFICLWKCQCSFRFLESSSCILQRDTLQGSLAETECRYNNHLAEIQNQISCVEQQLSELRTEMECQNREYRELLDVKCRLEQEIQTYRSLLEGGQHDIM